MDNTVLRLAAFFLIFEDAFVGVYSPVLDLQGAGGLIRLGLEFFFFAEFIDLSFSLGFFFGAVPAFETVGRPRVFKPLLIVEVGTVGGVLDVGEECFELSQLRL